MLARLRAALAPKRQSSPEISSLASRVLRMPQVTDGQQVAADDYNALLRHAKRLAGSALSQDES